jgi:hypothetical protein
MKAKIPGTSNGPKKMTERYQLVLDAERGPWRTPGGQRLRAALKVLGRGFGLRVIECKPVGTKAKRKERNENRERNEEAG